MTDDDKALALMLAGAFVVLSLAIWGVTVLPYFLLPAGLVGLGVISYLVKIFIEAAFVAWRENR